ncbi:MAG: magnesium transporter [Hyphomicrobiaceae bacterium]|nr:magnesium transporter [Hyphomicrobiaceae bacterium]
MQSKSSTSAERAAMPFGGVGETAQWHVVDSFPIVRAGETVGEVRARLLRDRYELLDIVVVVDQDGLYFGAAPIGDVLTHETGTPVSGIVRRDWPSVSHDLDQEKAVETAILAGVATLPVVDDGQRPIGCIPAPAMLVVLAAEHREDMHRMAGILRENSHNRHALEGSPLRRFRLRLPWLLVGLVLSTAGTAVMAGFEATLSSHIVVTFFIPALVYLTDAIGTQTEAVAVRGLSVAEKPLPEILVREVATGGLIGGTLGLLAFLGVWLGFGDARLALSVGLALLVAGTLACAIGLVLPWGLSRLRIDPALGSGPVATIVQDVLTLLVYFYLTTILIGAGSASQSSL